MKYFQFDKQYLKISIYLILIISFSILFEKILSNINIIWSNINGAYTFTTKIVEPFIIGAFIAYILNPFLRTIEKWITKKWASTSKNFNRKRLIAIFITYIIFLGLIVLIFAFILPEVIVSIGKVIVSLPANIAYLELKVEELLVGNELTFPYNTYDLVEMIFGAFNSSFTTASEIISSVISKIVTSTVSMAGTLLNYFIGMMLSFYMLLNKEKTAAYFVKVAYLILSPSNAERFLAGFKKSNKIFENFFVGKAIDSLIIGILCFFILSIIKSPYILLFSVIIGVTNMIPFFGPFIGAIPVIIITLFHDPVKALWVALSIFLLQQFDGIVLGPKILGESTGLSPIWVIFAITVGGALFGPLGMLLGVPFFAVIKIIADNFLDNKFNEKYSSSKTATNRKED